MNWGGGGGGIETDLADQIEISLDGLALGFERVIFILLIMMPLLHSNYYEDIDLYMGDYAQEKRDRLAAVIQIQIR